MLVLAGVVHVVRKLMAPISKKVTEHHSFCQARVDTELTVKVHIIVH